MRWRTRDLGLAFAILILAVTACGAAATATPSPSKTASESSISTAPAEERVLKVAMTFLDEPPDPFQAGWLLSRRASRPFSGRLAGGSHRTGRDLVSVG